MVTILNTPWLLLDYKNKKAVDFSDYRYCIIALTSKIMKADGAIKECELDKVKTTIRRYYKTEEEFQTAQKKFQEILDNDLILLNQICDNINNNLNYVAKSELIMELLAIAYADDKFLENEKLTIETIVKGLNITPQEYKSIYAIFIMKYQQGYYNEAYPEKTDNYNHNFNETETEKRDKQSSYRQYNGISEEDAYIILGIEKSDSDAEIKKAYHSLAVKCHPDNASSLGDEAIRQATETMKQINVAWEVVKMARGIK
ncbi:MAG: TerB family tellurite resistance protein [Paludibacteraceae bacterium]|nr:TerB family tellurite resistance protein [Paludibacteraceae bacterium]